MSDLSHRNPRPIGSDPEKAAFTADLRQTTTAGASELRVPGVGPHTVRPQRPLEPHAPLLAELRSVPVLAEEPATGGDVAGPTAEASEPALLEVGVEWPYESLRRARRR